MINIEEMAKESLQKFYSTKKYSKQPKIDMDNIRVQVEEFGWKTAKYRIYLFFLHQRPSFIPYHQNFWMAQTLFMTKTGEVIKNDQVYTSRAVRPEKNLNEKKFKDVLGFFPGNYYFKKEFNFIDKVLKSKKMIIKGKSDIFPKPNRKVKYNNGIADLETLNASIIQLADGYEITMENPQYKGKYPGNPGLSMDYLHFKIMNTGEVSEITTLVIMNPALE